jgi:PAS domain S-box-containing protein
MKVKKRLQLSAAVSIMTVFAVVLLLFLTLSRVKHAMEQSRIADEILISAFERSAFKSDYLQNNNERAKIQWLAKHEQIGKILRFAADRFKTGKDKKIVEEMIEDHERTGKIFSTMVANRDKKRLHPESAELSEDIEKRLVNQLNMRLYAKVLYGRALQDSSREHLFSALRLTGLSLVVFIAIIAAAAAINSWTIGRTIINRIRLLREGATVIGEGNLDHRIEIRGDDEFAALSESFNAMTVKLQASHGDLENEIAERRQTEELLWENEARLKRSQEIAHLGSWELDVVNNILTWSDEVYRIFGLQPREFEATYGAFLDAVHPGDRAAVDAAYSGSLREGRDSYQIEHRVVRKSTGEVRCVHEKCEHIRDETGRIIRSIGMVQDITERKQAEEALRESEDRYRALSNASSQVLYRMSPDWSEMRHLQGGSFIADTKEPKRNWLQEYIHPDDQKRVLEAIAEAVGTGNVFELEHRVRRVDGTLGWTFSRAVPVRNAAGDIVEWFGAASDITGRKRAEEELRTERDRAQRYLDIAGVLIIVLNRDRRVSLINQKGCEILGRSEKEIVGKNWFDHFIAAEDKERVEEAFNKVTRGEMAPVEYFENPVVTSGGGRRLIAWHNSLIKDESGKITGVLSSGEDITESRRAEHQISSLNRELTQNVRELASANKELEAFIYSVAHDLRAPLRSISGFSDIMLNTHSAGLDKEGKKHLHRIISGAEQMNRIIDDLLHLSRISRHETRRQDVDMSEIARSAVAELRAADPDRRVAVDIKEGMVASVDRGMMQVALSNLLSNAWKFTSKKTNARIEFGALEREGKTVYYVKDNGVGFDQHFAERVFLPFHRLHTEQEFEGTGIGLAIVERVIRRHGGRIWAEGKLNEGAAFFFTVS